MVDTDRDERAGGDQHHDGDSGEHGPEAGDPCEKSDQEAEWNAEWNEACQRSANAVRKTMESSTPAQ